MGGEGGGGGMVGKGERVLLQELQARDAAKGGAAVRLAALEQREASVKGLASREKTQQILRVDEVEVVAARCGAVAEHVQRRYRACSSSSSSYSSSSSSSSAS